MGQNIILHRPLCGTICPNTILHVDISGIQLFVYLYVLDYRNIDQTLANLLHGLRSLLNAEIGGSDGCIVTTEYNTRVHCIHM